MAEYFAVGEIKERPGSYYNIQKEHEENIAGAINGIVAVTFRSDWGPLNKPVEINKNDGYESTFGSSGRTDVIKEAFNGGAETVICCRIGSGGTAPSIVLKDSTDAELVKITGKYVGTRDFSVSIKTRLSDITKKECIIYNGSKECEKFIFEKGGNEAKALVGAMKSSESFNAETDIDTDCEMNFITQESFQPGAEPNITMESYSDGFQAVEAYKWNTLCTDTIDSSVNNLMAVFLERISLIGQFGMGVITEDEESLTQRMKNASTFNSEKMHYLLNPCIETTSGTLERYHTVARMAGMIAAIPSNKSLTHKIIPDAVDLKENLTTTQIVSGQKLGSIVFTVNRNKQIWIDSAINTLVYPNENQDEGWKKIRRTKTRYELIERITNQTDLLIGEVDNDTNGRATIIAAANTVAKQLISEGKLIACTITEGQFDTDSAWFVISATDKDSAEKIYHTFKFKFSTN